MNEETVLEKTMLLIMHGGNAKGKALTAIKQAKLGKFDEADELLVEADAEISLAHKAQTDFLVAEASGQGLPISILLIHGQDHLMTALSTKELATEMVDCFREIHIMKKEQREKI